MNLNILHVSDSHIFSLSGNLRDILSPGQRALNSYYNISKRVRIFLTKKENNHNLHFIKDAVRRQAYDHLIFTGDLTQTSNYNEFCIGRYALRDLRDEMNLRFSIIPGNHDILPNKERLNFYDFFHIPRSSYIQVFREAGYCVIGLDSTSFPARLRSPVSAIEYATIRSGGSVSRRQLLWLRGILQSPDHRDLYKIVLLHHHPITHRNDTFIRNLALPRIRNSKAFVSFLRELGVNLVLYGHKHPKTACYKKIGDIHFVLGPSIRDGLYNQIQLRGSNISIKTQSI